MSYAFRIINVFIVDGDRFSGNPLAVFEDARGITTEQMQSLARQLNLSETTFVLPGTDGDARVRIFTPGFEMPFAGHPALGTASVIGALRQQSRLRLEMIAGIVEVTAGACGEWTLRAARAPVTRPVEASRAEIASMVSLPEAAIAGEPLWVDTGVEQLVIPISSPDYVRAARPVLERIERFGYSAARTEAMAYLWAREGGEWPVRFFFTSHGAVIEDPATGSACANLGGYLLATNQSLPLSASLRQGDAVGRPSRLGLRVGSDRNIFVTGATLELGRGTIDL